LWDIARSRRRRGNPLALLAVIPAEAGIHWLQVIGDPCFRRDDGKVETPS